MTRIWSLSSRDVVAIVDAGFDVGKSGGVLPAAPTIVIDADAAEIVTFSDTGWSHNSRQAGDQTDIPVGYTVFAHVAGSGQVAYALVQDSVAVYF
jgi:hypothetical protein